VRCGADWHHETCSKKKDVDGNPIESADHTYESSGEGEEVPELCGRCGRKDHDYGRCTWKTDASGNPLTAPHTSRRREIEHEPKFEVDAPHLWEGKKRALPKGVRGIGGKGTQSFHHLGVSGVIGDTLMGHMMKIHPEKYKGKGLPYDGPWSKYVREEMFQNPKPNTEEDRYVRRLTKKMTGKAARNKLLSLLVGKRVSGKDTVFADEPVVAAAPIPRKGTSLKESLIAAQKKTNIGVPAVPVEEGEDDDGKMNSSFDTVDPLGAAWGLLKCR